MANPAGDDRRSARPPRPATTARGSRPGRTAEPSLPDGADPRQLDPAVRRQLNTLPPAVAERVAKHLVVAGQLLDTDPPAAHRHAVYAREQAARVAATREAAGITGYLVGDYAQALADLRTVRRMTGETRHLAIMADCERGLGRPERAVELAQDPDAGRLDDDTTVELMIVLSGARRDLGQFDAAVAALEGPYLNTEGVAAWTPRLWYAYADALIAAGREEEGVQWLRSVAVIDTAEETDAAERVAELDGEPGAEPPDTLSDADPGPADR